MSAGADDLEAEALEEREVVHEGDTDTERNAGATEALGLPLGPGHELSSDAAPPASRLHRHASDMEVTARRELPAQAADRLIAELCDGTAAGPKVVADAFRLLPERP